MIGAWSKNLDSLDIYTLLNFRKKKVPNEHFSVFNSETRVKITRQQDEQYETWRRWFKPTPSCCWWSSGGTPAAYWKQTLSHTFIFPSWNFWDSSSTRPACLLWVNGGGAWLSLCFQFTVKYLYKFFLLYKPAGWLITGCLREGNTRAPVPRGRSPSAACLFKESQRHWFVK